MRPAIPCCARSCGGCRSSLFFHRCHPLSAWKPARVRTIGVRAHANPGCDDRVRLPPDRVFFIPSYAAVPFQYYFRTPLADSRSYKEAADVSPADLNIDRFWLVFIQRQAGHASEAISIADRTHLMTYSLLLPRVKVFLFERRDMGR